MSFILIIIGVAYATFGILSVRDADEVNIPFFLMFLCGVLTLILNLLFILRNTGFMSNFRDNTTDSSLPLFLFYFVICLNVIFLLLSVFIMINNSIELAKRNVKKDKNIISLIS